MRNKSILLGIITLLIIGCKQPQPTESYNTMTILGTYTVDIESQKQGGDSKNDLWFEHEDKKSFYLVPKNGMRMAVVNNKNFSNISQAFIAKQPLKNKQIGKENLTVGSIILFKTGEGHYGKLQIKGYRALHDFNFPEAQTYLDKQWRTFVSHRDNVQNYHMVVAYKLYE